MTAIMEKTIQQSRNNGFKRTGGKLNSDVLRYQFYSDYAKTLPVSERIGRTSFNRFTKDLISTLVTAIIEENLELKFTHIGRLRVREKVIKTVNIRVDWKTTWEYWNEKYPGLTRDEILQIKDKKTLRFDNEISAYNYSFYWDKLTVPYPILRYYKFKASKHNSIALNKSIINPDRKVFYYG